MAAASGLDKRSDKDLDKSWTKRLDRLVQLVIANDASPLVDWLLKDAP